MCDALRATARPKLALSFPRKTLLARSVITTTSATVPSHGRRARRSGNYFGPPDLGRGQATARSRRKATAG
jgi:hypothetical protein